MEDPRANLETSVEGNNAESADGTLVLLTGTPHKTRNELQNSLRVTPRRLPIVGKPCECEQEAANSVVTAGCTNGTVERAKPTVADADVDRMALLGGEPAERASGVDEGDGMECEPQMRLQQTILYCKEVQRSGIANRDVPITNRLPLEGEWTAYPSGKTSDLDIEPADSPIELEDPRSGGIPHVHLRDTNWHAGDANGPGNRLDGSRGLVDGSGAQPDALSVLNDTEMVCVSHGEGAGTYLGTGDAKCGITEMDGVETHAEALTGHGDVLNVNMYAIKPENEMQIVSIPRKREKPPDLPVEAARCAPEESDGLGDQMDTSSARTDIHSAGNETEMSEIEMKIVSNCRNGSKTRNSLYTHEIVTSDPTYQWKRVSVEDIDVYLPWNAPIEALGQTLAFGEVESGEKAIAPGFEGEGAGIGIGDRNGGAGADAGDGDEGNTTSGSGVDSIRVKAALLAAESQPMRQTRRTRSNDLPMSSGSPIRHANRPYGLVRPCCQHRIIKFIPIKVNTAQKDETTYRRRTSAAQPPVIDSKCAYRVIGLRRQRGRMKIETVKLKIERLNDERGKNGKRTYLGCTGTAQPPINDPDRRYGVHRTRDQDHIYKHQPNGRSQNDLPWTYPSHAATWKHPRALP